MSKLPFDNQLRRQGLLHGVTLGLLTVGLVFIALNILVSAQEPIPSPSLAAPVTSPDLRIADEAMRQGRYEESLEHSRLAVEKGIWNERWYLMAARGELSLGRLEAARDVIEKGLSRYASSIQLRWIGANVLQRLGATREADEMLDEINELVESAAWRYGDRANRIVLAKYLLHRGADPKEVLESVLDRIKEQDARYVDAYLATAELALSKNDAALASDELTRAIEIDPDLAEAHWMIGQAFLSSDSVRAAEAWQRCLEINPRFTPCLATLVDRAIDAENYQLAQDLLDEIESIDPRLPELWSYRSVLSELRGQHEEAAAHRERALADWKSNPAVDQLIGRKLSQKYRFAEGAAHQRRALSFDSDHLQAALQLGQDLLRLGQDEGWDWITQVRSQDPYQVTAYNLTNLREELEAYDTLETDGFIVRMKRRDSELYGEEVLTCLTEARDYYQAKYQVEISSPVLVEIFDRPSDFAVRTFGVPGVSGYLGVCFGHLITVTGPAAQKGSLSSWQSVLWHEFGHTITLAKTRHRLPRWLGEGISVYEETERDAGWGRRATAQDRRRILSGGVIPVSGLSAAFLRPESSAELDFAYLQASWVVAYLIETRGLPALLDTLNDLDMGLSIDEALGRRWGPMSFIDADFGRYARERATREMAADPWTSAESETALQESNVMHFETRELRTSADRFFTEQRWQQAATAFEQLDLSLPPQIDRREFLVPWSLALERCGNEQSELQVLKRRINTNADDLDALDRGLEIAKQLEQWDLVAQWAQRRLGVAPLTDHAHREAAAAFEFLNRPHDAIRALRRLETFAVTNQSLLGYRLAVQLIEIEDWQGAEARLSEVLSESPRFRKAWTLYQQVQAHTNQASN